ncbi:M3 family metallopeptidase [Propionibacterium cyclohexanicum]|nr:M3 family metallopeptidase [Propionibacterium cyclohexanicum]
MSSALPEQAHFHLPDFGSLDPQRFGEAVRAALATQRQGLDEIGEAVAPPTEDSVIGAWERAGVAQRRACAALFTVRDADTTAELDALCDELAPELAAHDDSIWLDARLYERVRATQEAADKGALNLDAQARWWLAEVLREFARHGVQLDAPHQERLRQLNATIASLESTFSQLLVTGRNAAAVPIESEDELAGLSEEQKDRARRAAQARGRQGWLLELVNTTNQDWLAALDRQDVRQRVFEASVSRGATGAGATGASVVRLARLRAERATLLGFDSHAAYVASAGCAKTVEALQPLLDRFSELAVRQARADAQRYERAFAQCAPGLDFRPWDWAWVAAKLRAEDAVDDGELRPYLEFHRVLHEGVFEAARRLYGITVHPRGDLHGYTPDTSVHEVREEDGTVLGLLVIDPWARPSKQGGAWMTDLVARSQLLGDLPVVTLNTNIARPRKGEPALLSWDQVITCFHEFGHCLHGLFADSRYPSMSGTNAPTDYVEFPSQVNEHWALDRDLISHYARHWNTGEAIPGELIDRLERGRLADIGFEDLETAAAMQLDQAWHSAPLDELPTEPLQVDDFEARALAARKVDVELVPPRYRTRYFSHIWAGGYDAAYYAYLWAEVFDADACAWFDANGGLNRQAGERFRREVLAPGGSVDVMETYRAFRGADPDVEHLIARHCR